MPYVPADLATDPAQRVRLLINDTFEDRPIFADTEIAAFLLDADDNVRLAAAEALDTIASDEALTSKVIKDRELTTDGAKVAEALHKRAESLRKRVKDAEVAADEGYFEIVPVIGAQRHPEWSEWPNPVGWP